MEWSKTKLLEAPLIVILIVLDDDTVVYEKKKKMGYGNYNIHHVKQKVLTYFEIVLQMSFPNRSLFFSIE